MKPEYSLGISIIIYIAFAQFIDAFTSVNMKYYHHQSYIDIQYLYFFNDIIGC